MQLIILMENNLNRSVYVGKISVISLEMLIKNQY